MKLFNIVRPARAYFGQKDAQQAVVIRRVVRDLNLDVEIRVLPTVRDADGLALSSRNVRLSAAERARALALPRALARAQGARRGGDPVAATRAALNGLDSRLRRAARSRRRHDPRRRPSASARTRLIDNVILEGELT